MPVFSLLQIVPTGCVVSQTYPMIRERTASGKRGHKRNTWPAWSSVAFLHELAPFGRTIDFHCHSRIGVSLRRILPLISRLIVELSSALFMYSAGRPPSSTILRF